MALDIYGSLEKSCPDLFRNGRKIKFQVQFDCPISILEANVKEYVVDEYERAELLILRMYDAGIKNPSVISELSGINKVMVKKLIDSEKTSYGHIDLFSEELTQAGKRTLEENKSSKKVFQYALYDVKRNLQVESLTGTVIKPEAENIPLKMKNYNEKIKPNLFPKGFIEVDEELSNEINRNLQYYVDHDYLKEGNTIESIGKITAKEVRYRRAYFVYVDGFTYPFIAMSYRKTINNRYINVIEPTAIAKSDAKVLNLNLEECPFLVRDDSKFSYLLSHREIFFKCGAEKESVSVEKTVP